MNAIYMTTQGERFIERAYSEETRGALEQELNFLGLIQDPAQLEAQREICRQADYIFSTWGMFNLNEEELKTYFPRLKAVFYAAGSVQGFARPLLKQGFAFSAPLPTRYRWRSIRWRKLFWRQRLFADDGTVQRRQPSGREQLLRRLSRQLRLPGRFDRCGGHRQAGYPMLKEYRLKVAVFDPF
ncbi:MAG: hypothetical protein ACLSB9_15655 [Hydrogeniiclostridium mannosilyticum]